MPALQENRSFVDHIRIEHQSAQGGQSDGRRIMPTIYQIAAMFTVGVLVIVVLSIALRGIGRPTHRR